MQKVFAHADDVLMSDSQGKKVLLSLETGRFVELNATGRAIWELTDGDRSLAVIGERLQDRFDVGSETCRAEVEAFMHQLLAHQLVFQVR